VVATFAGGRVANLRRDLEGGAAALGGRFGVVRDGSLHRCDGGEKRLAELAHASLGRVEIGGEGVAADRCAAF